MLLHLSVWNFILAVLYPHYLGQNIISWLCFIGWILLHTFRSGEGSWIVKYNKKGWEWLCFSIIIHMYPLSFTQLCCIEFHGIYI